MAQLPLSTAYINHGLHGGDGLLVVATSAFVGLADLVEAVCSTVSHTVSLPVTQSWPFTRALRAHCTLGTPPGVGWLSNLAGMGASSISSCLPDPLDIGPVSASSAAAFAAFSAVPRPPHILCACHGMEGLSCTVHRGPPVSASPPICSEATEDSEVYWETASTLKRALHSWSPPSLQPQHPGHTLQVSPHWYTAAGTLAQALDPGIGVSMGSGALCATTVLRAAAAMLLLLPLFVYHPAAAFASGFCWQVLLRLIAKSGVPMGRPSQSARVVGAQLLPPRLPLLLLLLLLADPHATHIAAGQAVGTVSTLAGTSGASGSANGLGTAASFNSPYGVAIDAAGTVALIVSGPGENTGEGVTLERRVDM